MNLMRMLILAFLFQGSAVGEGRDQLSAVAANQPIPAILDSISPVMIRSYLDTLVGFSRRHTMDDTVSQTNGIGAARRWIYKKFLEFRAGSGGRLQVQYFNFNATICGTSRLHRNVMAILPGTLTPQRYFVVSGHYDTRGNPSNGCAFNTFSPGANDDGSGTVVSLELARVMSRYEFDASLIFMAVTGEDEGLYGSEAYASYAQSNGIRIDGMITNDIVGNIRGSNGIVDSNSVRHFSSVNETTPHRQLSRYMKLKGEFYYSTMTVTLIPNVDRPGRSGDHVPFQNHGYAAVRFVEPNENTANQHTSTDIVANLSPSYIARVARVNAAGLASLALAPERPALPTVTNTGSGTSLFVQWISTNTEPDFAGYRIAVRDSGGLFYNSVVDAGDVRQYTLRGLTQSVPVYVSISAYDVDGHESLFSPEQLKIPRYDLTLPIQLASFTASQTGPTSVRLDWSTLSETNTYGFYAQRRTASESTYVELPNSFIPGNGTTTEPHSYSFVDEPVGRGQWYYRLKVVDLDGSVSYTDAVHVDVVTSIHESAKPVEFRLFQNYPNPFNPVTRISYEIPASGHVTLKVYDILGNEVAALVDHRLSAGHYQSIFDAASLPSGFYFYKLQMGSSTNLRKMLLLR